MLISDLDKRPIGRICTNCGPSPDAAFGPDLVRNGHRYPRALCRDCHNSLQQDARRARARTAPRTCSSCGKTGMKSIDHFPHGDGAEVCRRCRMVLNDLADGTQTSPELIQSIETLRLHLVAHAEADALWHSNGKMGKTARAKLGGPAAVCWLPRHATCVEVLTHLRAVAAFWDAYQAGLSAP